MQTSAVFRSGTTGIAAFIARVFFAALFPIAFFTANSNTTFFQKTRHD
jgi:hypothetical protein